jgi:hypothetical protein
MVGLFGSGQHLDSRHNLEAANQPELRGNRILDTQIGFFHGGGTFQDRYIVVNISSSVKCFS